MKPPEPSRVGFGSVSSTSTPILLHFQGVSVFIYSCKLTFLSKHPLQEPMPHTVKISPGNETVKLPRSFHSLSRQTYGPRAKSGSLGGSPTSFRQILGVSFLGDGYRPFPNPWKTGATQHDLLHSNLLLLDFWFCDTTFENNGPNSLLAVHFWSTKFSHLA